jgi:GTP cyclohydrolase I
MNSLKLPSLANAMPDIANAPLPKPQGTLDWVGMANVHQPFLIHEHGQPQTVHGVAQIYVDLADSHAKGIHMSRLYLLLQSLMSSDRSAGRYLRLLR